jgi:hypothetical protein
MQMRCITKFFIGLLILIKTDIQHAGRGDVIALDFLKPQTIMAEQREHPGTVPSHADDYMIIITPKNFI